MGKRWGNDNQIIINFYYGEGSEGCHKRLPHRTKKAIQKQAQKLGIKGKIRFKDLTGNHYGNLIVEERGSDYISPKGKHYTQWWCKCKCGKRVLIHARNLVSGSTVSCGNCPLLKIGKRYNKWLEPIKRVKDYINPNTRKHSQRYRFKCHYNAEGCKGEFIAQVSSIKGSLVGSCGCLHREQLIKRNTKPEGTHTTPLITTYYNSSKYHRLQDKCFDRDNSCCIILGKLPKKLLTTHHIIPRNYYFKKYNITTKKQMFACKELWNTNNLVTISEEWHLGIKIYNPLALHRLYHGSTYKKENYYIWLKQILGNQ